MKRWRALRRIGALTARATLPPVRGTGTTGAATEMEAAPTASGSGPDSLWHRPGIPPEALVFTASAGTSRRLFRNRPGGPDPGTAPEPAVPANLRPWTWEVLPHVGETCAGSPLARILDLCAWITSSPDARYILHAERLRRRGESLTARALVRLAAAFAGRPPGRPPWLARAPDGDGG